MTRRRYIAAAAAGGGGFAAITDSFARADNASSLGTADTGQVWTLLQTGDTWGISTNQAYCPSGALQSNSCPVLDRGTPNMTVQATMLKWVTSGGNAGLVWRVVDFNNYWWSQKVGGQLYLRKVVANVDTVVLTPSVTMADGDVLTISVNASHLHTVKLNGTTVASFTDSDNSAGTKAGFSGVALVADRFGSFSLTSP